MVEVDASLTLTGPDGPLTLLDAFEGRCYLRDGDRAFETYWTTIRGVETMDNSYALMDLTVYGRQEGWEDSPAGWPQDCTNTRTSAGPPDWPPVPEWPTGRPIAQWPRLGAGHSDDLGISRAS
jgi:hypothetical protein